MTELRMLFLANTEITDTGLAHLRGLTDLRELRLQNTAIGDAGLAHLSGLTKLEWLELTGTQVSDAGLMHLKGLTNLKSLFLDSTRVTKEGAEGLAQALPNGKVYLGDAEDEVFGLPGQRAAFGPVTERTVAYREGFPSEDVAEPGPMYLDLDTGTYAPARRRDDRPGRCGRLLRAKGRRRGNEADRPLPATSTTLR